MGIVKKHLIALYLNAGTPGTPDWFRIKKSTALDLALNPETKEYDYIVDESPTTELDKYKPSINQALTMYKGEPDYEYVFNKFYNLAAGEDAKTEALIVYMQESAGASTYKAWKTDAIISINDMNAVDSTITFDIMFGGTTKKGTATVTDGVPTFSETGGPSEINLTVTVEDSGSDPVEGATVTINGVSKDTDASGEAVFTVLNNAAFAVAAKKNTAVGSAYVVEAATAATVTIS